MLLCRWFCFSLCRIFFFFFSIFLMKRRAENRYKNVQKKKDIKWKYLCFLLQIELMWKSTQWVKQMKRNKIKGNKKSRMEKQETSLLINMNEYFCVFYSAYVLQILMHWDQCSIEIYTNIGYTIRIRNSALD